MPGIVGVSAKSLTTGTEFLYNADDLFFTASTFKVPLLVGFYSQVELGNIGLNDRVEITEDSKVAGTGVIKEMAPGMKVTFRDLAKLMIIISDNTATDIIYNRVGKDYLHKLLFSLGMVKTKIPMTTRELLCNIVGLDPYDHFVTWTTVQEKLRNKEFVAEAEGFKEATSDVSSPREMANLLEMIERREIVSTTACNEMLDILKRQQLRELLPKKLPTLGTSVAHKTGGYHGIQCDVGVVYANNSSYTVAIMAKEITDMDKMQSAIANLSQTIYHYFASE